MIINVKHIISLMLVLTATARGYETNLVPHVNEGDGAYAVEARADQAVWVAEKNLYFQLPADFPTNSPAVYVEIVYYDESAGPRLTLQYDSLHKGYAYSIYHTRSSCVGSMAFETSYHRLDAPSFGRRGRYGSDFRIDVKKVPVKSVTVRDERFSDPKADRIFSDSPPWLSPYTGPSRDEVNAKSIKGKVLAGYQGWFRVPNDLYDSGFRHWTVDMWPDTSEYDPSVLFEVPGATTLSGKTGKLFSSAEPSVVQKHFEWMRKYNIDGVYLQRFFVNSTAGDAPEWVLANVRDAAHVHGRVWAIEYDLSGGTDTNVVERVTRDWKWLVDQAGITKDSRYLHEQGKPVVVLWGASIRDTMTIKPLNKLLKFFKDDPVYGGNYVVGCVDNSFPSAWDSHYRNYDSIFAWMGSQQNVANKAEQFGLPAQVHVWPGFSWHNLKRLTFDGRTSYSDRKGGEFFWNKIYNGIEIVEPEALFIGMFDEYDEGTAIMPMTDDPPVVPGENGYRHFITNDGMPKDWWMMLSGYANDMLNNHIRLSDRMPSVEDLSNRSNIGQELTVTLGSPVVSQSLRFVDTAKYGETRGGSVDGVRCRIVDRRYICFDVDNSVLFEAADGADVTIIADYYDSDEKLDILLEYDGVSGPLTEHPKSFKSKGDECWKSVRFEINDAFFGDRMDGAVDFRFKALDVKFSRVRIILPEVVLEK